MDLKLSVPNFAFPLMPWPRCLRLIRDLDISAIDLGIFAIGSNLRPSDILSASSNTAGVISADIRSHDLRVADVFGIPGKDFALGALNHMDRNVRGESAEFFWHLLELATLVNAQHLTLLPGIEFPEEPSGVSMQRAAEELAWRVEAATRAGITLAVEPHIGSIISTPELAERLLSLVHGLSLTLDYAHFAAQGIPHDDVKELFFSASHFHLRGACKGKLQSSLEQSTIDFPRIVNEMSKLPYDGYFAIEYIWTDWMGCNQVDNLSEILQLRDCLRDLALCDALPNRF